MVSETGNIPIPDDIPALKLIRLTWPLRYVARVTLHRPPVNALNLQLWSELEATLLYLESLFPRQTRALILDSGLSKDIYSAGNDLSELHVPSTTRERFYNFWITSTRTITTLYTSPLLTVADVRGFCPAGGCILALACDKRIFASNSRMGLNESSLGIPVPRYWAKLFLKTSNNHARAEACLLSGEFIPAKKALEMALITDIDEDALQVAGEILKKSNHFGRSKTKGNLRQEFADQWLAYGPKEAELAWMDLSKRDTVAALGAVLKRLSRPKM